MESGRHEGVNLSDLDAYSSDQYRFSSNARIRRELMEHTEGNGDFYRKVIESAGLNKSGDTLDVGCGDGRDLFLLADSFSHTGKLVGLEIPLKIPGESFEDRFDVVQQMAAAKGYDNISFVEGFAQRLPFADNSFDNLLAAASVYHWADIMAGLLEARRVVKPGGKLIFITNEAGNMPEQHKFLESMGERLNSDPPPPFSSKFTGAMAREILPQFFRVIGSEPQDRPLPVTEDIVPNYLLALDTRKDSFKPPVTSAEWLETRRTVVEPIIRKVIEADGVFYDRVKRVGIYCENLKD